MAKIRFQDSFMQKHYEKLIEYGYHWKIAEIKTIETFREYDS